ncbi:MAG: DUF4400 domain-containing protein [Gammaproteobacteria bacterium]
MIRAWLLILLWIPLAAVILLLASADWVKAQLERERQMVSSYLGPESAGELYARSISLYKAIAVNSGAVDVTYRWTSPWRPAPTHDAGSVGVGHTLSAWMDGRIEVFWRLVYQGIYRLVHLSLWLPYLSIFLFAALADGLVQRAIKKVSIGGYASPIRYNAGFHALFALLAAPLIYLSVPLSVPPISVPIWAVLACVSLVVYAANIQKRI